MKTMKISKTNKVTKVPTKLPILRGQDAVAAITGGKKKGGKVGATSCASATTKAIPTPATSANRSKKISGLDAAAQVLAGTGKPMNCQDIVETMLAKGLWKTGGKTPHATIYSAMLREIDGKPGESRFIKTGRGLFGLASK